MFDKICYYVEEIVGGIMFVAVFVGLFTWVPAMMKATMLAH